MAKRDNTTFIKKANIVSTSTANKVSDVAGNIASRTNKVFGMAKKKISDAIEGNAETVLQNRQNEVDTAMKNLTGTEAEKVLAALGGSPLELSNKRINQIRRTFPIPREQCILWADAEFDLRPSGIVATERGVFIRSNVGVFDEKFKKAIEHENGGKSMLFYYIWDDFDPAWFTEDSKSNRALSVESQCSGKFISACHLLAPAYKEAFPQLLKGQGDTDEGISKAPAIAGAAVLSSETAVFTEQKAYINNPAGHGEMVEEANTMLDNYHGIKAKVVGRDNAKNGADRLVDGIFVQTKYYGSARGSLEACFDPTTGSYRYMNDGVPMQLEVPKDQYQRVLEGFKKKIADGKVPGVTDPNEASNIVREGRLTYQQAVNLTKPGRRCGNIRPFIQCYCVMYGKRIHA